MYKYNVTLVPELLHKKIDMDLSLNKKIVFDAALEFNENSRIAIHPKYIEMNTIEINKTYIYFTLSSSVALKTPVRALRGMISSLSHKEPYKSLITQSGRLFRGRCKLISCPKVDTEKQDGLSDEEASIQLVKLFYHNSQHNADMRREIKKILMKGVD